ncbi:hypothetical protein DV737_g3230, partial [Chaetothyriales sp. CBS 132003]
MPSTTTSRRWLAALVAATLLSRPIAAKSCISLAQSTACVAFNSSSISTDSTLVGLFPFLAYVSNVDEFDEELNSYISQDYVSTKYVDLFGCDNVDLSNTSAYYARYTRSFICNSIVQNSKEPCGETSPTPLCADSCALLAQSEYEIVATNSLCSGRDSDYQDQLRADFTNCALPANSLSGSCISGETNEPENCGYSSNLIGLCDFCRDSTTNATDSCCLTSNATGRCEDVSLPVFSSLPNLFSTTTTSSSSSATASSTSTAESTSVHRGSLSKGAIAGIVVGSVIGFLLMLALLIFCCILIRRWRRDSKSGSLLNQPSPQRKGVPTSMSYNAPTSSQQGYEVLPGGRVARMSALQTDEPSRNVTANTDPYGDTPRSASKTPGVMGAMGSLGARKHDSPGSNSQNGSSPHSNEYSSPEGMASGQSEQLPFFKDYYSNDDIHPGDKISVLWAYQPRAGDEFELERGDMLKVVGIWDDGWATGVRIDERAEDYEGKGRAQRDSGVSQGSGRQSPTPSGEIKAFPLVCVCLPEAWRKTVEGDTSTEGGSGGPPPV